MKTVIKFLDNVTNVVMTMFGFCLFLLLRALPFFYLIIMLGFCAWLVKLFVGLLDYLFR